MVSTRVTIQAVDRESWTAASKRSTLFDFAPETYTDVHYNCVSCGTSACFLAQEQKIAYEKRGRYIRQRRKLCKNCFGECEKLLAEKRMLLMKWKDPTVDISSDRAFLEKLRAVLQSIGKYGVRIDRGNLAAVEKRLENAV